MGPHAQQQQQLISDTFSATKSKTGAGPATAEIPRPLSHTQTHTHIQVIHKTEKVLGFSAGCLLKIEDVQRQQQQQQQ